VRSGKLRDNAGALAFALDPLRPGDTYSSTYSVYSSPLSIEEEEPTVRARLSDAPGCAVQHYDAIDNTTVRKSNFFTANRRDHFSLL
jgi:hypothetical protein